MKSIIVICSVLALSSGLPFPVLETDNGEQFYLVPLSRNIRDTTFDVAKKERGDIQVTAGHEGYINLGNSNTRLTVGGSASKQYHPKGPTTLGASVGLEHRNSGTAVKATVNQTPKWGTDLNVQATKTFLNERGGHLAATAGFNQHLGGLPGSSKADPYVGLEFNYAPGGSSFSQFICTAAGGSRENCAEH